MGAWLVDFEDSFTHNVAAEFLAAGLSCQVVPWRLLPAPGVAPAPDLLVWGPGPGHPDDYGMLPTMRAWWEHGTPMAGVCLGHQLMARMLGLPVGPSRERKHGERVEYEAPASWRSRGLPARFRAQRYNSLAVPALPLPVGWEGWAHDGEWVGLLHERAMTYQFHPESVGTSCPGPLFRALVALAL